MDQGRKRYPSAKEPREVDELFSRCEGGSKSGVRERELATAF